MKQWAYHKQDIFDVAQVVSRYEVVNEHGDPVAFVSKESNAKLICDMAHFYFHEQWQDEETDRLVFGSWDDVTEKGGSHP